MKRAIIALSVAAVLPLAATATPTEGVEPNCRAIAHRGLWQGQENQPEGITRAAPWGFAEIDAQVLADGTVAALHDFNLRRLTGGDYTGNANEVTWAQLQTFDHPYGPFHRTTRLILQAKREGTPIMVTINRFGDVPTQYRNSTLDTLYTAAQANPDPVFFGGADDKMRERHPDADTFVRYNNPPPDDPQVMIDNIKAETVDLAGIPRPLWTRATVRAVRDAGAWAATPQTATKEEAREAQAVGIDLIQGNNPEAIATRWCQ